MYGDSLLAGTVRGEHFYQEVSNYCQAPPIIECAVKVIWYEHLNATGDVRKPTLGMSIIILEILKSWRYLLLNYAHVQTSQQAYFLAAWTDSFLTVDTINVSSEPR